MENFPNDVVWETSACYPLLHLKFECSNYIFCFLKPPELIAVLNQLDWLPGFLPSVAELKIPFSWQIFWSSSPRALKCHSMAHFLLKRSFLCIPPQFFPPSLLFWTPTPIRGRPQKCIYSPPETFVFFFFSSYLMQGDILIQASIRNGADFFFPSSFLF